MKELLTESVYFGVTISIVSYGIGLFLKKKLKWGILNPLLVSILFVVGFLILFDIDYDMYNQTAKYLSYLLTPATVALAIPLYQKITLLKKNGLAVFLGILSGVLSSLLSVLAMAWLFGLSHREYVTLLPKSITTAIGMGVSDELGGITTITVAVIIVTGVLGNVIGQSVCKLFKIYEPIAVGLALGTSAHAIGTAKALELGEVEGAMSSLSIVVSGLITVVGASVFAMFL
ncbi:TIGR00659 family protein [Lachnospiraceae bacterium 2_1_46FAA]|nr:TIGR00659 family protein [Lachnospiraceae bacterium 2_1_46FAA]